MFSNGRREEIDAQKCSIQVESVPIAPVSYELELAESLRKPARDTLADSSGGTMLIYYAALVVPISGHRSS